MTSYHSSNECYMQYMRSIEETVARLYYYLDTCQFDKMADNIFTPKATADYTLMFGGEAKEQTAAELAGFFKEFMTPVETSQHMFSGFLPLDMDWPHGQESLDRDTITVVANGTAHLQKKVEGGRTLTMRNGGRGEFVMKRVKSSGDKVDWRISSYKVFPIWLQGDDGFFEAK